MFPLSPISLTLLPTAALSGAVAAYAWRKRPVPGASSFSAFMLGGALWAVAVFGIRTTPFGTTELSWSLFQYFGIVLIPPAWLLFALDYTSRDRWLSRETIAAIAVPPLGTLVTLFTNPFHELFYDPTTTDIAASASIAGMAYGPAFYAMVVYSYLYVLVGSAMLVRLLLTAPKRHRLRVVAILIAIAVPMLSNFLYLIEVFVSPVDPAPYAFAVSGIVFGWALFDQELFEVPPVAPNVAHTIVFEQTDDGVLILDAGGYVVDHNDAAVALLDLGDGPDGRRLEEIWPESSDVLVADNDETVTTEFSISGEPQQFLEVTSTPIRRRTDRQIGRLVRIHDVTERRLREQRLDVLQRVLRHNVRQETNKIVGYTEFLTDASDSEQAAEYADAIDRAADSLIEWSAKARTIERTLDPGTGEQVQVRLDQAIESVIREAEEAHPHASFELTVPETAVSACHPSIEEALYEIVDNAAEHTDADEPSVRVAVTLEDEWIVVRVSDDGEGLPPAEQEVLDRGRETPLEHGSGLGLWLVNWSVAASGGSVEIDTGDGTTVQLRLPRAKKAPGPIEDASL